MHLNIMYLFGVIHKNGQQGKRKFVSLYPIYGLWSTLQQISKNILLIEPVYRLDKDLNLHDIPITPRIPLSVGFYSKGFDIDNWDGRKEILNIRGNYGIEIFKNRLERGDYLFVGYSNREFVGFVWIEFPPVTEAGYALKYNEAYTYDGWTFEKFRGNGILPAIQQSITNYVRDYHPDIKNIVTHVANWNKASLSGDQKAGYRIVRQEQTIVFWGIHRKQIMDRTVLPKLFINKE
jgi:RimJ/RimL family protein N-acetyltransferase